MHSNPSATTAVDPVDVQTSTPPDAEAGFPRSEDEAMGDSAARAPKPDGPKKSDPFQFGSR